jgi:hypothetical protein
MGRTVYIVGNGPKGAPLFKQPNKGIILTCNVPPFAIYGVYGTIMCDFKIMKAVSAGEIQVHGDWILGFRPKQWAQTTPGFMMKFGSQIKEFYTELPPYAGKGHEGYTNFNCGHLATYYACRKLKADTVHMYGFDSLFELDIRSTTDFVLPSDRSDTNTLRLADKWRPIFQNIFNQFPETKFKIHYYHDKIRMDMLPNMEIVTH